KVFAHPVKRDLGQRQEALQRFLDGQVRILKKVLHRGYGKLVTAWTFQEVVSVSSQFSTRRAMQRSRKLRALAANFMVPGAVKAFDALRLLTPGHLTRLACSRQGNSTRFAWSFQGHSTHRR